MAASQARVRAGLRVRGLLPSRRHQVLPPDQRAEGARLLALDASQLGAAGREAAHGGLRASPAHVRVHAPLPGRR
jgi:hypothetical protein